MNVQNTATLKDWLGRARNVQRQKAKLCIQNLKLEKKQIVSVVR